MGYSLGIDLGTTYTAAAVSDGQHAEIVPLSDRSPQAPSVVYRAPDGTMRYGETAERHAAAEPERIAREFKRRMGDQTPIFVAGAPMSAHALSKALLGWAIDQVVAGQGESPERVTVTCPANWGPYRRELMSQVTALNADYPISVCTEPAAAALHFAASRQVAEGRSIAVYDLGGGTFDAAVLRRTPAGDFEVLGSPDGLEHVGGVDFDEAVFQRVSRGIDWDRIDPEDPDTLAGLARLRRDCTEAKEALSSETETTVPILLGGRLKRVRLTRAEFQELISPLVTDSVDILDRVIRRSGIPAAELAAIVLVGGSSRVPLISELLTRRFGRPVILSAQPKLCVAMGAALLGAFALRRGLSETTPADMAATGYAAGPGALAPTREPTRPAGPPEVSGSPVSPATADLPPIAARQPPGPSPVTEPPSLAPGSIHGRPDETRPEAAAQPGSGVQPAHKARRRLPTYRLVAASCAIAAVLLMGFTPPVDETGPRWDTTTFAVSAAGQPAGATLTATILGIAITRPPEPITRGEFNLRANQVFLSGPTRGRITSGADTREVVLSAADRWSPSRWLSLPFAALVLTSLFSFAYAESILRPIRQSRRRAAPGEFLGLVGSGLVAGIAAVLATWVIGDRLPTAGAALAIVVCVCAAVGLLAFAWSSEQSSGVSAAQDRSRT
jgi:actin-like ATPase involved in cell morphogenesis